MPKLIIQDQTGAVAPKSINIMAGKSLADALHDNKIITYADTDRLYINGKEINISACGSGDDEELQKVLTPLYSDDAVTLVQEVKGGIVDAVGDLVTGAFELIGIDLNPDIPEIDTERGSPNNSYQSQTNVIRAFAQRPLVCGSPKIFPDLIGEAIEYYVDNIKQSEQYFEVCFGTLVGGSIQAGNTSITRFSADVTRLEPVNGVTTIPDYRIGQSVDEVDGQTVRGTNEGTIGTTYDVTPDTLTPTTYAGTTYTTYIDQDATSDQLKTDFDNGDINSVEVNYITPREDGEGIIVPTNVSGNGVMSSMTLSTGVYTIVITNFNGPFSQGTATYTTQDISTILSGGVGPFANPIQCDKMLFNIIFRQGLKNTVDFQIDVYELDSKGGSRTGTSETFTFSYTEDSPNDQINKTEEITIANGVSWYEFEIIRTNEESQDTTQPDVPTLEAVYCIEELGDYEFNNATMLKIIMRSTQLPTSGGVDNKINIEDGQMNMPSYDLTTSTITDDAPSRDFADAILFIVRDFYGRDPQSFIDLDKLYTLRDKVAAINPEFVQFDYTFDDAAQSLGERIDVCCNVARIFKYWEGTQISFWRDEAVAVPSAVLGRSDVAQESDRSYNYSRQFYVEGAKESVQIEYVNREQNKPNYIYRTILPNGNIVNTAGENPKAITLTGCQSQANAINRADLEIRKILYNQTTITDTFFKSQNQLSRGQVVIYNEVYETGNEYGGSMVAIDETANVVTTNNLVDFDSSNTYQVYYTNELGVLVGPQNAIPLSSYQFQTTDLSQAYVPTTTRQIGSRYYITQTGEISGSLYRILEKQTQGPYVQITALNYDDRVYEND